MTNEGLRKAAVVLGFIGLSVGIFSAFRNPATEFELSPYTATPVVFWICSCFALLVSVLIVFSGADRRMVNIGAFLGGFAMTSIVSIPIIRGYQFMGPQDSLSHLGTAVDMNAGLLSMTDSLYPAVHMIGSVLHDATGLPLTQVFLIVVVVFIAVFFLFIPLSVRRLTGDPMTTYIGVYSGLLLLPLNHISPSTQIHPTSQALMYAPVLLFAFFALYRNRTWWTSFLFVVIALFFILLHPQQAANLVAFSVVVAGLQIGSDLYRGNRLTRYKEWIVPEVAIYSIAFWLWSRSSGTFWDSLERVSMIPFVETQVAETTATRSLSLAAIGGSLPEIFVKLFLVSLLFALLTALLMVSELVWGRLEIRSVMNDKTMTPDGGTARSNIQYILYGLLAVGVIFFIYLLGGISDQYFRHLGMLMVFASILGSIALGRIAQRIGERRSALTSRRTIAVFLLFCLVLSIPVVFVSPYIYDSSDHVTEMQMSGYETTFHHQSESIAFGDIRSSTSRYGNAIQGRDIPSGAYYEREDPTVPDHFADRNLPAFYEDPTYVPVPEADRKRDAVLWEGFRFSHEDFEYLDGEPEIDRVQTNGGYDLYLVNE